MLCTVAKIPPVANLKLTMYIEHVELICPLFCHGKPSLYFRKTVNLFGRGALVGRKTSSIHIYKALRIKLIAILMQYTHAHTLTPEMSDPKEEHRPQIRH